MAIETGTDKNAIGRVKHHRAGAARADNGPVVYKKVGKIANSSNVLGMFTTTCLIHRQYKA